MNKKAEKSLQIATDEFSRLITKKRSRADSEKAKNNPNKLDASSNNLAKSSLDSKISSDVGSETPEEWT